MGTTYHITAVDAPGDLSEEDLQAAVDEVLKDVNAKLSNWDKASEVSVFNQSSDTAPMKVSADFIKVMVAAGEVHEKSDRKFDVTLGPLVELWGFGPRKPEDPVPADDAISAALAFVGQADKITVDESASTLAKSAPEVGINLSAIAKGFGIDAVAGKLKDLKVSNYMVEIGGDLVTAGKNEKGDAWKIGIESPDLASQAVEQIVSIQDLGLATSGDYRNFFEQDGVRYSHIIDPTTGRPITHWTTSVSVVAENAMMADAWATAMLVVGADRGMEIAEQEGLAVYFISRAANGQEGEYTVQASSAFEKLLGQQ